MMSIVVVRNKCCKIQAGLLEGRRDFVWVGRRLSAGALKGQGHPEPQKLPHVFEHLIQVPLRDTHAFLLFHPPLHFYLFDHLPHFYCS